jgi:hypothetical protein
MGDRLILEARICCVLVNMLGAATRIGRIAWRARDLIFSSRDGEC